MAGKTLGPHTVNAQLGVTDNLLDLALLLEISKRSPCQGSVDLETVDEGGNGDQAVRLDILLELVVGLLVEDDGVVGLILDCGLSVVELVQDANRLENHGGTAVSCGYTLRRWENDYSGALYVSRWWNSEVTYPFP